MDKEIRIPWNRWASIPFLVLSLALLVSFWPDRTRAVAIFWLGPAAALGVAGLAFLFNHTGLRQDGDRLLVRHAPVPFPGRRLPLAEIRAVWIGFRAESPPDETATLEIGLRMRDGRTVGLARGGFSGPYAAARAAASDLAALLGVPLE
jgi:hypothetical protein